MSLNRIVTVLLLCVTLARSSAVGFEETGTQKLLAEEERFRCRVKGKDERASSETITKRPSEEYGYQEYSSSIAIDEDTAGDRVRENSDHVSPTYVRLIWRQLERSGWAECSGGRSGTKLLELTLDNFAPFKVEVSLEKTVDVDGSRKVVPITRNGRSIELNPRSSKVVKVPLKLSRIEQQLNQSSGRMWVTATVIRKGERFESPHSSVVYFHSDEPGKWNVYNRKRLEDTFRGGDYTGELTSQPSSTVTAPTRGPYKRIQYASTGFSSSSVDGFGLDEAEGGPNLPDLTPNSPDWLVEAQREAQSDLSGGPRRRKLDIDDFTSDFVSLCFSLPAKVNDQQDGAVGLAESWWAVGLRYAVRNAFSDNYIAQGWLARGPNTCFYWNVDSDAIRVDFWLESKVGGTGRTLHVVTSDNEEKAKDWLANNLSDDQKEQASVYISNFGAFATPDLKVVEIDFADDVSVAHAAVVNGLQRLEFLTKRPDEFDGLRIAPFVGSGSGSWADIRPPGGITKLTSKQNWVRKFVYEHEVCHMFHFLLHGPRDKLRSYGSANYDEVTQDSPGDDNCPANSNGDIEVGAPGGHALRSLEGTSAAYSEGFAQFCATVILSRYKMANDDGTAEFRYYKSYPEYGYDFELVQLSPIAEDTGDGWPVNYLHNVCGCVGSVGDAESPDPNLVDYPCNKVGTELDWQRFWWAFLQAPGIQPSFMDVMDLVGEVYVSETLDDPGPEGAFDQLLEGLEGPLGLYYTRFRSLGCPFGVGGCVPSES